MRKVQAKSNPRFRKSLTGRLCHTELWRLFSFSNSILSSFEFLRDDVRSTSAKIAGQGHRTRRFLQHERNGTYLGICRTCHGLYPCSLYEEGQMCSSSPQHIASAFGPRFIYLERGISSRISSTSMKHIDILEKF